MTFAERLKKLRMEAGMTQAALADASGVALPTIRNYEQGDREPLLSTASKLAKALCVSVEAFIASEPAIEEPPAKPKKPAAKAKATKPKGK